MKMARYCERGAEVIEFPHEKGRIKWSRNKNGDITIKWCPLIVVVDEMSHEDIEHDDVGGLSAPVYGTDDPKCVWMTFPSTLIVPPRRGETVSEYASRALPGGGEAHILKCIGGVPIIPDVPAFLD